MTERAQWIVLASRPVGEPTSDNFRLEEGPIPQPGPGQMLLRTQWLSLDPYMRGRMSDAPSYAKPVGIGELIAGGTVESNTQSRKSGNGELCRGYAAEIPPLYRPITTCQRGAKTISFNFWYGSRRNFRDGSRRLRWNSIFWPGCPIRGNPDRALSQAGVTVRQGCRGGRGAAQAGPNIM
jgi:hypothetical protein